MCVVVRRPVSGESQGGHLVEIRQTFLARVFLGCILDARGTVLEWMEWWVQQPDAVAGFSAAHRQRLDNSILDRRWVEQVDGFEATGLSSMVCTGWERENPFPVWIDLNNLSATNLP